MESLRWIRIAPLAIMVVAGAVGAGGPVATAAADPPWDPPPCSGTGTGGPPAGTWYRMDPTLDAMGTLTAQRLAVGVDGAPARWLELAPESFASGPVLGLVLAGEDDGTTSRLRLLDPTRRCATVLADEADVIRSAVMAADGRSTYEHRVDRATRADLGVWRRRLTVEDGSVEAAAEQVLGVLEPDPELGRTFATDLVLAPDGRLVVSSCAERACRVRVLDVGTQRLDRVDAVGPALGVVGERLIAREACPGLPCGVLAVNLSDGRRSTLVTAAGAVALGGRDGAEIVYATQDGRVAAINALTGRRSAPLAIDGAPYAAGSTATSGVEAPPGIVALGAHGSRDGGAILGLDPARGETVTIGAVRP